MDILDRKPVTLEVANWQFVHTSCLGGVWTSRWLGYFPETPSTNHYLGLVMDLGGPGYSPNSGACP